MKLESTFDIEIEGAVFRFKKPTLPQVVDKDGSFQKSTYKCMSEHLTSIEGLELDGKPVKKLDPKVIPCDALTKISVAFAEKVALMVGFSRDTEKKD